MKSINLTEGNIAQALTRLAIPIMGTSFVQMAYNMTDLIWIGRVGSDAVAAVGTAGFFTWLAMAFIFLSRLGTEVGVAQSIGKKDPDAARGFVRSGLQLNLFTALVYLAALLVFRKGLIGFFNIEDEKIVKDAISYLIIVASGLIFVFPNQLLSGILNGYGDSATSFRINSIGLLANMILDPLLILGLGPFPRMEVVGAALATIAAQALVTLVFVWKIKNHELFKGVNFLGAVNSSEIFGMIKMGTPVALQEGLFASFAMVLARIISRWGPVPIAVQKVGAQIEAISWMTAKGFSSALAAFVGQNYGAGKWDRIARGYSIAFGIMVSIGAGAALLLNFAAGPVFAVFLPEKEALQQGIAYLKILSYSQIFMCTEIITGGALYGLGRTLLPALVGIVFNGLRIPSALILSKESLFGLNGVWWAITLSSIIKGLVLPFLYYLFRLGHPELSRYIIRFKANPSEEGAFHGK